MGKSMTYFSMTFPLPLCPTFSVFPTFPHFVPLLPNFPPFSAFPPLPRPFSHFPPALPMFSHIFHAFSNMLEGGMKEISLGKACIVAPSFQFVQNESSKEPITRPSSSWPSCCYYPKNPHHGWTRESLCFQFIFS